jgi:transposase
MARRAENRQPLARTVGWRDVPDSFWTKVELLLPRARPVGRRGRPAVDRRRVFNGIVYVLRTGCQWKMMPREYGSAARAIGTSRSGGSEESS